MKRAPLIYVIPFLLLAVPVWAFQPFIIASIKINGLQSISRGTVFNYLPLKVGDELDEQRAGAAIKALFKTGFFSDVRLEHKGELLIVTVVERPAIASVTISGNKEIDTETLTGALKQVGLAENRVFDRFLLDKVKQELQRQYFALGKYGVNIESQVVPQERNRVAVSLDIEEGEAARIRRINIVGNKVFKEKELVKTLQLSEPTVFSFFTDSDKYSKQKLRADLESLRSFYMDRGFINIGIVSTQVTITPDKRDIYITINITEGEKYYIDQVKLVGEMVVPREELRELITIKQGDAFSRNAVTVISNAISERLGDEGYAFANINAIPEVNEKTQKVSLKFFVDPAKRVYVRRINITGNDKTQDEVIRRELRQMEGGWFVPKDLNRSRVRIQRLSYFDEINIETPAVPGTTDQVDVNVVVAEGHTGSLEASLGYGEPNGLIFTAKIAFNNFAGTGKRIILEATRNDVNNIYSFSYTNPYYTNSGVSRSFSIFYRETDFEQANVANYNYNTDDKGARVNYGFPLSEFDTARLGFGFKNTYLDMDCNAPDKFREWVEDLIKDDCAENTDYGDPEEDPNKQLPKYKGNITAKFNTITLNSGWTHDTRNRTFLADRGFLNRLSAEAALPGGDLQYYKLNYNADWNWQLIKGYTLQLKGIFSYGDGYGKTDGLPFFERYFAGGSRSVRGFRTNRLGPKDPVTGDPIGGNIKLVGNLELIFPVPFVENSRAFRASAFIDAGNVFNGKDNFTLDGLRTSYGVSVLWVTPLGVFSFSWALPFNEREGDETEFFQFFIGAPF